MKLQPIPTGPGQESVWDYPRPPVLAASNRRVVVRAPDPGPWPGVGHDPGQDPGPGPDPGLGAHPAIADSRAALRVLETSHPPTWYVPPSAVAPGAVRRSAARATICEFKGAATYWDVITPDGVLEAAAWSYEAPEPRFAPLAGYLAFAPSRLACSVDGEPVRPQEGGFYGGWITDDVVGPFKGAPGTWGW
jgi:uncharacterized protein (DUF427 family)